MTARTHRSAQSLPRAVLPALFAAALLLRLLVPQGWMPVTDAAGIHLAPCSGSGPLAMGSTQPMAGAMHHGHHMPGQDQGAEHVCPFAAAAQALTGPDVPGLPAVPPPLAALLPVLPYLVGIGHGLAAPPPPATGPPAHP